MTALSVSPSRRHRLRWTSSRVGTAALAATLAAVVMGVAPASAASKPDVGPSVIGTPMVGARLSAQPGLRCLPEECGDEDECPPFCQEPEPIGCDFNLLQQSGTYIPEGRFSHVVYGSSVTCVGGAHIDHAYTYISDRSLSNIGLISPPGDLVGGPTTYAQSSGHNDLYADELLPAATTVEQVLAVQAHLPFGVWAPCGTRPTNHVLWCNGVGTSTLNVGVAFFQFDTHLTG